MSVPAAYVGVVLLWATTPLAIKWSVEGSSYLFGITARMGIGMAFCLLVIAMVRIAFPWDSTARRIYLVAGATLYGSMLTVYWGAQFIPSGLIAVIFGLTPLATGVMAGIWLNERGLTPLKLIGMTLGFTGLAIIFDAGREWQATAWQGILAMLLSLLIHSAGTVWVKRLGNHAHLHPLAVNGGALCVAAPLFLITWFALEGTPPDTVTLRAALSIAYLGIVATVLGFTLYYYILRHLAAGVIALITLITPVLALLLGQGLNGEAIQAKVWWGTAIILVGLLSYQWESLATARQGAKLRPERSE